MELNFSDLGEEEKDILKDELIKINRIFSVTVIQFQKKYLCFVIWKSIPIFLMHVVKIRSLD